MEATRAETVTVLRQYVRCAFVDDVSEAERRVEVKATFNDFHALLNIKPPPFVTVVVDPDPLTVDGHDDAKGQGVAI